jgi:hypothetical protein
MGGDVPQERAPPSTACLPGVHPLARVGIAVPDGTGFHLVSVLGVAGSAAMLYLYARTFFDRPAALRAVAYFVLAGNVLALLLDPWLVDGPAFFLSILSFLLVRGGHLGWATAALCLGVANHEGLLLVLATLLVAHLADNNWRFEWRLVPFVGLPVLVYVLIHYTSLVYGSTVHNPFFSAQYRHDSLLLRRRLDGNLIKSALFAFATSFGGVWMLAVLGFRKAPRFLRATAIILPALVLNFLNATDWDRVLTFAFPVVIVLACCVRLRWPILIAFLVVQAWLSGLAIDRITGYYSLHLDHPHYILTVMLLAVAFASPSSARQQKERHVARYAHNLRRLASPNPNDDGLSHPPPWRRARRCGKARPCATSPGPPRVALDEAQTAALASPGGVTGRGLGRLNNVRGPYS